MGKTFFAHFLSKTIHFVKISYVLKWLRFSREKNMKKTFFSTLTHMGTPPLKIKISKIGLCHVLSWPKLGLEPKFHETGTFGDFGKRAQNIISDFQRIFNTGSYGDRPKKN